MISKEELRQFLFYIVGLDSKCVDQHVDSIYLVLTAVSSLKKKSKYNNFNDTHFVYKSMTIFIFFNHTVKSNNFGQLWPLRGWRTGKKFLLVVGLFWKQCLFLFVGTWFYWNYVCSLPETNMRGRSTLYFHITLYFIYNSHVFLATSEYARL